MVMLHALVIMLLVAAPRAADAEIVRSEKVLRQFQRAHPCPIYGNTPRGRRGPCPGFVKDHVVPLCAGGADAVKNLQWQWRLESLEKDKEELAYCRALKRAGSIVPR